MNYRPLSEKEEYIGKMVVDAAYKAHKSLGPGLLESVYEVCFCYELNKNGLFMQRQAPVSLIYDNSSVDVAFRLDVLVDDLVICELKSVDVVLPIHQAQLLTYLKLANKRLGYLINFNVLMIKDGIKRYVL
jgi:GxxExxY protein